jgi:hypothetical protein
MGASRGWRTFGTIGLTCVLWLWLAAAGEARWQPFSAAATSLSTGETGGLPFAIAAGDLNGDHWTDLATVNAASGTTSLLANAGGGAFALSLLTIGGFPSAVALGDLGDRGRHGSDVAVTDFINNELNLFVRDGSGGYSLTVLPTGTKPTALAIGDLNGDRRGRPRGDEQRRRDARAVPPHQERRLRNDDAADGRGRRPGRGPDLGRHRRPRRPWPPRPGGRQRLQQQRVAVLRSGPSRVPPEAAGEHRRARLLGGDRRPRRMGSRERHRHRQRGDELGHHVHARRPQPDRLPGRDARPGHRRDRHFSTVSVAIARLTGRAGLAVANQRDDTVTVFARSAPWQAFDRAIVSTVTADGGHGPGAIALAELDGDRLPGIATANQVSGDVTLLTNNNAGGGDVRGVCVKL